MRSRGISGPLISPSQGYTSFDHISYPGGARCPVFSDKYWFSNTVAWSALADGGPVIAHPDIIFSAPHLFHPDGVHLSYAG